MQQRTSWQVTKSVWYALLLRELSNRMFGNRYSWFWLFTEPLMFVSLMVSIRTFIRIRGDVAGVEIVPWIIIGITAFIMFRDGMNRSMGSIGANGGVFAYRQVKPIDLVFASSFSTLFVHSIVISFFIIGLFIFGFDISNKNLLLSFYAWSTLWLLGVAFGLVLSVGVTIIPEISKVVKAMTLPLMILSGAFLPVQFLPYEVQQYLLWNPILHAIEYLRLNFFYDYYTMSDVNIFYVLQWLIPVLIIGFVLQLRFEKKLKAS